MTITASAAETPVVIDSNVRYALLEAPAFSYTVPGGPAFLVSLEREGDRWIVVDRETGIHGSGSEPSEAIEDFARALQEHMDVLERQDELSDDLARQLDYLQSRLRR